MTITSVKIRRTFNDGTLRAIVSIVLDGCFALHDIKVVQGQERLFVAMPSRKGHDDIFHNIAHPIDSGTRQDMEWVILQAYEHLKPV